MKIDKRNLT